MKHYYVFRIQYLGYRYHGWMIQPNVKTVQGMIDRTFNYILEGKKFKTLGSSRTDAMVSANIMSFELFVDESIAPSDGHQYDGIAPRDFKTLDDFLAFFNLNLPLDIRALSVVKVSKEFNIIQNNKIKEYKYLFSYGEKIHPFATSLVANFQFDLDIDLMIQGAKLFEGKHNFKQYCTKPSEKTIFDREVLRSEIEENTLYTANFFPEKSFIFHIHSAGFMRNQVRLMMSHLISLGRGSISLDDIRYALEGNMEKPLRHIVPASGLILHAVKDKGLNE